MVRAGTLGGLALVSMVLGVAGPAHAEAWKFLVSGDSRSNTNTGGAAQVNRTIVQEIGRAAVAEGAAFILSPGDQVYSGSNATDNATAFATWKSDITSGGLSINAVYPVMGNHDFYNSSLSGSDAAYKAAFNYLPTNGPAGTEQGRTYSFTYNNAIILGLDEYATSYQVNQTWLNAQLNAPGRAPHVFAFGHIPAFQVTTHHTDALDDHVTERNAFWSSLKDAGARVYFAGHEHFYDDTRLDDGDGDPNDDLRQIIVGTAGAPLTTNSLSYNTTAAAPYAPVNMYHEAQYGYMVVTVDGNNVTMEWKHRVSAGVYAATGETFSYAVPEPGSLGLLIAGLALTGLRMRRGPRRA